ncbi:cell division protein FtsA [Xylanivirga thermophila]|uniref:cell division protein FtsA n=1 Tax=Xylanivirga thermophila TaxID=2496273 RepID=UPI00101BD952|nr:cell division protein FtsA [Xylanivirga thermophila]
MNEYVAAIDFGTTKLVIIVGYMNKEGRLEVVGMGNIPYGDAVHYDWDNISSITPFLSQAVKHVQGMTGHSICKVILGIPGYYCGLMLNNGRISIGEGTVSEEHRALVVKQAASYHLPGNWQVFRTVPHFFRVDDGPAIENPIHVTGNSLKVQASLVCVKSTFAEQAAALLGQYDIEVDYIMPTLLCSGDAMLADHEKKNGSIFLDIGGKSTDIIVYKGGVPIHMDWLPVGGWNITNDLSIGLDISMEQAERLKRQCVLGIDLSKTLNEGDMILSVRTDDGIKDISMLNVQQIMEWRIQEIMELVQKSIKENSSISLDDGYTCVLTGGGVATIRGARDFTSGLLGCPVRIGQAGIAGASNAASLSSVYCLLKDYEQNYENVEYQDDEKELSFMGRIIEWFKNFF